MMSRVLLVEDDADTRVVFQTALSRAGYEVLLAADGEEALRKAREDSPDLILLDFSLPRRHGLSCMGILKANEETRHIPIIALTAHTEMELRVLAAEAGCEGYLVKPIEPSEVVAAVEAMLGQARPIPDSSSPGL